MGGSSFCHVPLFFQEMYRSYHTALVMLAPGARHSSTILPFRAPLSLFFKHIFIFLVSFLEQLLDPGSTESTNLKKFLFLCLGVYGGGGAKFLSKISRNAPVTA